MIKCYTQPVLWCKKEKFEIQKAAVYLLSFLFAESENCKMGFDYKSKRWLRKRESILRRDKYRCVYCRSYGRATEAVTVHHIKHVDMHPDLAFVDSNLVSLCQACHNKEHPEKGGRKI